MNGTCDDGPTTASARPSPAWLVLGPDWEQRRFNLDPSTAKVRIGRSQALDLVLGEDKEVSRVHAILEHLGGRWLLADLESTNGTFVGGERLLAGRWLRDGDRIRIGGTTLRFHQPASGVEGDDGTRAGEAPMALTPAQRRVLEALCRPRLHDNKLKPATNRAIAEELRITEDTVKEHLRELYRRFRIPADSEPVEKRLTLVQQALVRGLL